MEENAEFFDVLTEAIRRETAAFNYYYRASEKSPSERTKSLLIQLAEEERKHRVILIQEYQNLKRLLSGKTPREFLEKERVSFHLPETPQFKRTQTLSSVDLAAIALPSELVGGDFFDTFILRDQSKMGLLLFDVMGHGLESTELKAKTRTEWGKLKELYLEKEAHSVLLSPSSVVSQLNHFLWAECQKLACFLSMFYAILDLHKSKITYSSAGHEPPLLFGESGQSSLIEADLLMGVGEDTHYGEASRAIQAGDVLVIFSDGVVENLNPKDEEFGRNNLIPIVEKNKSQAASEIIRQVLTALRDFMEGQPIIDEFTLAVAKIK